MLLFLNSIDANNSAAIQDTSSFASGCKAYKLILTDLRPSVSQTTNAQIKLALIGNGAEQTGKYNSQGVYTDSGSTAGFTGYGDQMIWLTTDNSLTSADSSDASGEISIYLPLSQGGRTMVTWSIGTAYGYSKRAAFYAGSGYWYGDSFDPQGFILRINNGNIKAGNVSVYGITR